jgi:hypothetical protein
MTYGHAVVAWQKNPMRGLLLRRTSDDRKSARKEH